MQPSVLDERERTIRAMLQLAGWQVRDGRRARDTGYIGLYRHGELMCVPFASEKLAWEYAEHLLEQEMT